MSHEINARKRDMILKWHRTNTADVTETARLLKIPEQAVIDVINQANTTTTIPEPDAQDVPLF